MPKFGDASKFKNAKKDRLICSYCGISGHTRDKCYKLNGYPLVPKAAIFNQVSSTTDSTTVHPLTPAQFQHLISLVSNHLQAKSINIDDSVIDSNSVGIILANSFNTDINHNYWIVDSGATTCHIESVIHSFNPISLYVTLLYSSKVQVLGIGFVKISLELHLSHVLYIPAFHYNLLSLSALSNTHSCNVIFSSDSFFIQHKQTMKMISKGELKDGLYILHSSCLAKSCFFVIQNSLQNKNVIDCIWHYRVGHLSCKYLDLLKDICHMSSSILINKQCPVCSLAKQHRLSFHFNNNFSPFVFDLIHADV